MIDVRGSVRGMGLVFLAALWVGASACSSGSSGGTGGTGGHVSSTGGAGGHVSATGGMGGTNAGGGGAGGAGGVVGAGGGGTAGNGGAAGEKGGNGGAAGAAGGHAGAAAGGKGGKGGVGAAGGAAGSAGGAAGGAAGGSNGGAGGAATMTANLIVNGGAEADVGSTDGTQVPVTGWTVTGLATPLKYDVSEYPASTDPGPADRGTNLFIGGSNGASSSLAQTISLASYAAAIGAGRVSFTLSGWLGGYASQDDDASLMATFKDTGGTTVMTSAIGPVLAVDRNNTTGLLFRTVMAPVPTTARSVEVTLTMTRMSGTANDGYADNLSLVLSGI